MSQLNKNNVINNSTSYNNNININNNNDNNNDIDFDNDNLEITIDFKNNNNKINNNNNHINNKPNIINNNNHYQLNSNNNNTNIKINKSKEIYDYIDESDFNDLDSSGEKLENNNHNYNSTNNNHNQYYQEFMLDSNNKINNNLNSTNGNNNNNNSNNNDIEFKYDDDDFYEEFNYNLKTSTSTSTTSNINNINTNTNSNNISTLNNNNNNNSNTSSNYNNLLKNINLNNSNNSINNLNNRIKEDFNELPFIYTRSNINTPSGLNSNNSKSINSIFNSKPSSSSASSFSSISKPTSTSTSSLNLNKSKTPQFNNNNSSNDNCDNIIQGTIIKNKIKNNNIKNCIVTIYENKTREIGYSSYNQETGDFEIGQFCDSQTYYHLYNKLFILNPSIVIIPPIEQNRQMVKMIEASYPATKIIPIVRKLFNDNEGMAMIKQYCLMDKYTIIEKFTKDKSLAQASFSAIIRYLEQEISFVKKCIKIKYSGSENSMQIDAETIKNLELIHNSKDGTRSFTLYDSINKTKTAQGSRLLISNIVQPSNDLDIIKHRQLAIKELMSNEKTIYILLPILSKIEDIDKILLHYSQNHKKNSTTIKLIETYIKNFIEFKNIFEVLPKILNLLKSMNSPLLKLINNGLINKTIEELSKENLKIINEKIPVIKNAASYHSKVIYYIKDGINGLLDVCKKSYTEILNDIQQLTKYYQDQFRLPQLKLHYCLTKGFYYSLPCKNRNLFHLPNPFIRATYRNQKCYFLSEELISLSRRSKGIFEEAIALSSQSIESLIEFYRTRISELYNLSESISLLDFLLSGALYALSLENCVSPEIFTDGPLGIKSGYHPIQLKKSKRSTNPTDFVPNDTLINETSNFQLIHGPNMSGKSTYIQQVALLTIVGHIGYLLPAEFSTMPLVDQIISRIGTSDNIESNASTFMTEMKEMSYILENATSSSLVIIDELGRGTSNMDGSSIAWAISEKLSMIGCYTLFVTHYPQLMNLAIFYPNIKMYHFQVSRDSSGLKYSYLLSEGISSINRSYGIDTAELAGIDSNVIQIARMIKDLLDSKLSNEKSDSDYYHPQRDSFTLVQKLLNLKHSKQNNIQLIDYLLKLKNDFNFN